jgi:hypothetical protein
MKGELTAIIEKASEGRETFLCFTGVNRPAP